MSTINDGGSAFPVPDEGRGWGSAGMTLRDYFAAKALAGYCSDPINSGANYIDVADWAYSMADAMLAVRSNKEGK